MRTKTKIALAVLGGVLTAAIVGALIFGIVTLATGGISAPSDSDRCESVSVPLSLWIYKDNGNYFISWYEYSLNSECGVTYFLQYIVDDVQEFQVNTTTSSYTISNLNLENCSTLLVRLWVISQGGVTSEDSVMDTYREIPTNVQANDFNFTNLDEGLVVTWDKPIELLRCDLNYTLEMSSELFSRFNIYSNIETAIIPHRVYCFEVTLTISGRIAQRTIFSRVNVYRDRGLISNVQTIISTGNPKELIVTWPNHRQEEQCSVEYSVELHSYYSGGISDAQTANVIIPEARFNFPYCAAAVVLIFTYGLDGRAIGPYAIDEATAYPEYTINIAVDPEKDTNMIWYQSSFIETCNVTYLVNITTDLRSFVYDTEESSVEFSDKFYCVYLDVQIQAVINEQIKDPTIAHFELALHRVEELELVAEASSDNLSAKWESHPKEELCGIDYVVTFGDGIDNQTTTTKESNINFDISYCADVFIIVKAVSGSATSEGSFASYDTGSPVSIGIVQNIIIDDAQDGSLIVTWNSPAYVAQCNIEYTVTAIHPVAGRDTCSGRSGCGITLSNFCPSTSLEIVATLLDGQTVLGEPTAITYIC